MPTSRSIIPFHFLRRAYTELTSTDYNRQDKKANSAPKRPEDPDLSDCFPVEYTVPALLGVFGDILGMEFLRLSRKENDYQAAVKLYLEGQGLAARDGQALEVYRVSDTTGFSGETLGLLVLDLEDRDDKAREVFYLPIGYVLVPPLA